MNGWPGPDHACPECGFDYACAATTPDSLVVISTALDDVTRAATAASEAALRTRPSHTAWSALEYCCHIRDVLATGALRLYRARTEDLPQLEPMLNEVRARLFRYNNARLDAVLADAEAAAAGLAEEASTLNPRDWQRQARRLEETRTAEWLLRHATHEVLHHLLDIQCTIAAVQDTSKSAT